MLHHKKAHSFTRKMVITTIVGGLSFPLTNLLFQSNAVQLAVTAAVGAVILIIQFLVEVDDRLSVIEQKQDSAAETIAAAVRSGFSKVNEATRLFGRMEEVGLRTDSITQLISRATELGSDVPEILASFVRLELDQMSDLMRGVVDEYVNYEGEDRNWLLSLSRSAQRSIDAVSLPGVDSGKEANTSGFWNSDLGHRYLTLQHEAVRRNVRVRRVFIIDRPESAWDAAMLRTCWDQAALGIEARLIRRDGLPQPLFSNDFILFDDTVSYEVTPCEGHSALILHTRLILDEKSLKERRNTFEQLWESATVLA